MENLFRIELNHFKNYSFGFFHSGLPMFDFLYLENLSSKSFSRLKLSVKTTPNILLKDSLDIDFIASKGFRTLSCDFLRLDISHLASLSAVENVSLRVILSADDEIVGFSDFSARLLPYTYFSGLSDLPETLAFFVTPQESDLLKFLDGFLAEDPLIFCRGLYDKIKGERITYVSRDYYEASSFSLRLPERVLAEHFANSLELSLLFASACEKKGLYPFLAFSGKNRVLCGFSLDRKCKNVLSYFSPAEALSDGLYFLDSTYLAYGSELSFDDAFYETKNLISLADENLFVFDVYSAREMGLIPLPNRYRDHGTFILSEDSLQNDGEDFGEFYALLKEAGENSLSHSILLGEKIPPFAQKNQTPFQIDFDINQNKLLNKVLSNPFTLIRAQTGSGASSLFARAAEIAAKKGKSVLYISDHAYHSQGFKDILCNSMDCDFIADFSNLESNSEKVSNFSGHFHDLSHVMEDRNAITELLAKKDAYYTKLEGERRIVSSFSVSADRYHQFRDAKDCIIFSPEQIGALSDEEVQIWFGIVNELVKCYEEVGNIAENPLRLICHKDFSYEYKSKLITQLEDTLRCIESIISGRRRISAHFTSIGGLLSRQSFFAFFDLVRLFSEFETVPFSFFEQPDRIEENFKNVTRLIQAKRENDSIRQTLSVSFHSDIFELDAVDLYRRFQSLAGDKSFKGMSQKHSIFRSVKRYLLPNCDVENVEQILFRLYTFQMNLQLIKEEREQIFRLLSISDQGDDSAWGALQIASDLCYQCYSVYTAFFTPECLAAFVSEFCQALRSNEVCCCMTELQTLSEEYKLRLSELEKTVSNHIDFFYGFSVSGKNDYFDSVFRSLSDVLSAADRLKDWCGWLSVKSKAVDCGLNILVSTIEAGKIDSDELKKAFLRAFFKAACEYNFIVHPELVPNKHNFEEENDHYFEFKQRFSKNRKAELDSILSSFRMDALREVSSESSVHDLLRENFSLYAKICPISISDLTQARLLFSERNHKFDYVFIESRSSLSLRDLIWLFSLGGRVSFAGMPTLSSLKRRDYPDISCSAFDYLWQICEEKYSLSAVYLQNPILNSVKSAFMEACRSDLRAYSAPAIKINDELDFVNVSGFYGREYADANLQEAEYCTDTLIQFAMQESKKSIGIITATEAQKNLILRLFAGKLRHQEDLSSYFSDYARFHIVSVEDEIPLCDFVFFSSVFSPDKSLPGARMPYGFFSFGGDDPHKLLYHIFSSAKEKITFVTSFGKKELRFSPSVFPVCSAFNLVFSVLEAPRVNNSFKISGLLENSSVIQRLSGELSERGFSVEEGIQSGRYFIDLAVRGENGNFLLGIISDQTVMNQMSNVYAVEMLNLDFYKKCGWNIFRLRTTKCFESFDEELESILSLISPQSPPADFL